MITDKKRTSVTAAYAPPGSDGQKLKRIGRERVPRWLLKLLLVLLFVAAGVVGDVFVSLWQPGSPLGLAPFWLLYIAIGVALFFRDFLGVVVNLLRAWPRCDRCGGLGHPLARTAVERGQQLYVWGCRQGHLFHTSDHLQVLPHTRELRPVPRSTE